MAQLPSGRQVGIVCLTTEEIIRKAYASIPKANLLTLGMSIVEIDSVEALKPYIKILFVRDATSESQDTEVCDKRSHALSKDSESYDSEFTLADYDEFTAGWSEEDKQAFNEFINSERVLSYFQDALKQVKVAGKAYQQGLYEMICDICD